MTANPNPPIDRDALHRYLWDRRNPSNDQIVLSQSELAEKLDIARGTAYRLCREFMLQGRMKKVGAKKGNIAVYRLADPAAWDGPNLRPGAAKTIKWG